ncbi:MAG TPA: ATP phosphoribosyltransferase regulatory subunit [Acidimicrobiales bacterium]|nr:ATP phosphoribosyltransferase regulatory subunit [Acidimicrobiales bacterium]
MAQRAQPVRGMRDILPPQGELRRRLANAILEVYTGYGFEVIETPALEDLEVLLGSGGGENEKLIFKVLKRGERLGEELARGGDLADAGLRFDLTVPLARFVANHLNELPVPFKVAHLAPVWRGERPARGRFREFVQCDIDIVGEPSVAAEVELCSATLDALHRTGVSGCTVKLNDRRLLRAVAENYLGPLEDPAAVFIELDKLERDGADAVAKQLADFDRGAVRRLLEWLEEGDPSAGPPEIASALEATLSALSAQGYSAAFDPALVRGIGYYTGQIFEVRRADIPYSLAGGGRYDGMTERFGAPALPMCGFSIGFERIADLVDPNLLGPAPHRIAVTCASDEDLLRSLAAAHAQRTRGENVVVSVLRRARNYRKQQQDLEKLGYSEILDSKEFDKSVGP